MTKNQAIKQCKIALRETLKVKRLSGLSVTATDNWVRVIAGRRFHRIYKELYYERTKR